MTIYCPQVFTYLRRKDCKMIDLYKSFNLNNNIQRIIEKFGGPDGGKGGEFFYFSDDNKIIVKTMTDTELNTFKMKLRNFIQHFIENPESLISKIYGIYTFTR